MEISLFEPEKWEVPREESNNPADLTGSLPTLTGAEDTLAGTSHTLPLKTAYYTAQVPIWIDVIPTSPPPPPISASAPAPSASPASSWSAPYLSPEAREVLSALGAFIIQFRKPSTAEEFLILKALLREVARVRDACADPGGGALSQDWDGVCVAVGTKRGSVTGWSVLGKEGEEGEGGEGPERRTEVEVWDDLCAEVGFEFVDGEVQGGKKRNEFGELTGIPRLLEALQANDWAQISSYDDDDDNDDDLALEHFDDALDVDLRGPGRSGFGVDAAELEREMLGMKRAIYAAGGDGDGDGQTAAAAATVATGKGEGGGDEEGEVEQLEALMLRMQAVRDMGADMPEAERKRFAARAVKDIMKTL